MKEIASKSASLLHYKQKALAKLGIVQGWVERSEGSPV